MTVTIEQAYPTPCTRVWEIFQLRDYWVGLLGSSQAISARLVHFAASEQQLEVCVEKELESSAPKFARLVVGDTTLIRHSETWTRSQGEWRGAFTIEVDDGSATMTGEAMLAEVEGETLHRISLHADVDVPLIGRRLAKMLEEGAKKSIADDHAFTVRYLVARPSQA